MKGNIKEGKKGKEGLKPNQTADCSTDFTVKPFEPPTISCSASPTTVKPGDSATITASASSPQNRPLTYSYSASSGSVNGTGTSASSGHHRRALRLHHRHLQCAGRQGPQRLRHHLGGCAGAPAAAAAEDPDPLLHPVRSRYHRPARVNNEAKACLDDVALNAQQKADATLVLVGNSAPVPEKHGRHHRRHEMTADELAAQRAVNTKDYLVTDKGIDASRIQVRTGTSGQNEVGDYLVPSGANFDNDVSGTSQVSGDIQPQPRNPVPPPSPQGRQIGVRQITQCVQGWPSRTSPVPSSPKNRPQSHTPPRHNQPLHNHQPSPPITALHNHPTHNHSRHNGQPS